MAGGAQALDALRLPHQCRVFNTYPIDALITHEVTNGTAFAILLDLRGRRPWLEATLPTNQKRGTPCR